MKEWEGFYRRGLERVARIVEGATDYDSLLGPRRLGKSEYLDILAAHKAGDIGEAARQAAVFIRRMGLTVYRVPADARIVSFAKTHNNRVQLEFFIRKTSPWRSTQLCELSACEIDRTSKVGDRFSDRLEAELSNFMRSRGSISKALIHQSVAYSVSYCGILSSLRDRPLVSGLVVANDHSPGPVAASMGCAELGIKRVYLQHAQVTSIFPTLDFEYSILMDKRSEQVYRQIGKPAGQVAILRRPSSAARAEAIFDRVHRLCSDGRVSVGLYPSAVFDNSRLRALVELLKGNPYVSRIFLKPHPSMGLGRTASDLGVESLSRVPDFPHIAITGNSSVALELAVCGNIVFQDFGMDPVAHDYYGFVREGLTAEVDIDQLPGRFWCSRGDSDAWVSAVGARLGESTGGLEGSEEQKFLKRLAVDIGGGLNPALSARDEFHTNLRLFPQSFFSLMRGRADGAGPDDASCVAHLDSLFNERVIGLGVLYAYIDPGRCRSVLDFWFIAKRVEWSGLALDDEGIQSCCDFVRKYSGDKKVKRWLETKVFDLLLRLRRFDVLELFLLSAEVFQVRNAHLNKKIAFINTCRSADANRFELGRFYSWESDETLGDLDKLKISVQCMLSSEQGLLYRDYRTVQDQFLAATPTKLADEYKTLVCPIYRSISGRDDYVDVKRNPQRAESLVDAVCCRLLAEQGFSVIRLSDGEGYLFRGSNRHFTQADAANRERHWWGTELNDEVRAHVISSGIEAIEGADIIGVPSIYRFLRDHSPKSRSLVSSIQGRGLVAVLQGVLQYASPAAKFGDDKLNIAVFNVERNLKMMAECARKIVVVTGAKESVVSSAFDHLGELEVINVPTHNKTSANDRFHVAERPLPYVVSEIRDRVERAAVPGALVLVGAGVAGKSFVQAAKVSGAVGLDLGSALDELVDAGIHSLH